MKKAGALQPIPLPEWKWQQITTNLVTDLPESEGKTAIAVFMDRLFKMVDFALCTKEISAEKYASSSSIMCLNIMVYWKVHQSLLEGVVPEARNGS